MNNRFEFKWSSTNVYDAEMFMDFLNDEQIDFDITLANFQSKVKKFVFLVHANRLNVTKVTRYFESI